MKNFQDKVAVITGGASGVGRALAFELAREGARVIISDIEVTTLEQTIADIKADGFECAGQIADVTDGDSMKALAASITEQFGQYIWYLPMPEWVLVKWQDVGV